MSLDRFRQNAWSAKRDIDAHLESHRRQAKPAINVDAVVFVVVLVICALLIGYLWGQADGRRDLAESAAQEEPSSPVTKCTSYDIRDGQKYCLVWKRR